MSAAAGSRRVLYVDATRAYAIGLVVVSHVFAPVSAAFNDYPRGTWWFFNLLNSAIRLCVPLFVMISGKLLLGSTREEPYLKEVGRRLARIVPPFFLWSMVYAAYDAHLAGEDFSIGEALRQFLQGPTEFHLWFMYMIIGVYLIAPFLRRFVRVAGRREIEALLGFWAFYLILGFWAPGFASSGPAATLIGYGGYFVLGYYLDREPVEPGRVRALALLSIAVVAINALATYRLVSAQGGAADQRYYGGLAPLVALYSACFFLILKALDYDRIYARWPSLRHAVDWISGDSYNLYLIHVLWIWLLTKGQFGWEISEKTGGTPWVGVPLTSVLVFAGSLALSWLLRKTPWLSKLAVVSA
jgi:surface polysaccharide O-acyltransferase-like enzyme